MKFKIKATENNEIKNFKIEIGVKLSQIFGNNIGFFSNSMKIFYDEKWYNASLEHSNMLRITKIYTTKKDTSVMENIKDVNIVLNSSRIKQEFIEILLNRHKICYWLFGFKKKFYNRKKEILYFFASVSLSVVYFLINEYCNNIATQFIANNNSVQSLLIFLTLIGAIGIFHPITIQKQIDENDIENTIKKEGEKKERDRKSAERVNKRYSIGE